MRWRLGLWALALCLPVLAQAHAHLLGSEPPANALIDKPPPLLRLRFSEPVEKNFSRIEVKVDGQLLVLPANSLQWDASGKVLEVPLPAHQGLQYQVEWSILAKDGHPGKGRIGFKVKP